MIRLYSNALDFVTLILIGYRQKFATVYPAIYCRKQSDVINYVTFHEMSCGIMRLATFLFETKLKKSIRMEITIFTFFHQGRYIAGYTFGNHVLRLRRYTSPNEKFEYRYPLNLLP